MQWIGNVLRGAGVAAVLAGVLAVSAQAQTLVERLGFPADTKVLILNADDFGMNHAANQGTIQVLKTGAVTSATVMVPCPWFLEVVEFARETPQANLGLHLTLTSEWKKYKWGPVAGRTAVPGLCDPMGHFWPGVQAVYEHGTVEEAEKEIRAQIDQALAAGLNVTHIDSHMGTLQYNPKYHEMYIQVAKAYNLPCRIAGMAVMEAAGGAYLIEMADKLGVLHPEEFFQKDPEKLEGAAAVDWWKKRLAEVAPGKVNEIFFHCGERTPEMEATTGSWRRRSEDVEIFSTPEMMAYIQSLGIELISYRELRELQRTGKPMARVAKYGW
ncbi:MAG: polysaccharide deacetylase family protein [Candidatus Hydrogenedentes bacterium]|nr:polysaccharide deacetylase family protein [Candidatus Hydrogenedentota bacterium]